MNWYRAWLLRAFWRRMRRKKVLFIDRGPSKDCERRKPECAGRVGK